MNTKFQIQIRTHKSYSTITTTTEITLNDLGKFANLASIINKNSDNKTCNWFNKLPNKWNGKRFVLDTWMIDIKMKEWFGYHVTDFNLIEEFFDRFTPEGCDNIEWIKFFKVEEITEY